MLDCQKLLSQLRQGLRGRGLFADSEDELTRIRDDWPSLIPACAVTLQLLAAPRLAEGIVNATVNNYALPDSAVRAIRALSDEELAGCFA